MELDDLKHIWQQHHARQPDAGRLSPEALEQLLRGQSQLALARIRRSIRLELGILLIPAPFLLVPTLFSSFFDVRGLGIFILVLCTLVGTFLVYFYRQLPGDLNYADSPQTLLRQTICTVEQFLKIYLYGYVILYFLSLLAGALYGSMLHSATEPTWLPGFIDSLLHPLENWHRLVPLALLLFILAGTSFSIVPFTRWWLRKLYGKHLAELKHCLQELEEGAA